MSGDKSTYTFMSPSCVWYHGIYVSSRCGETNQHMRLCHLHVWGMTASMFPLCLGRQVIIFIYATSMRGVAVMHACFLHVWEDKPTYEYMPHPCKGYHSIRASAMSRDTSQHVHLCQLHVSDIRAFMFPPGVRRQV